MSKSSNITKAREGKADTNEYKLRDEKSRKFVRELDKHKMVQVNHWKKKTELS